LLAKSPHGTKSVTMHRKTMGILSLLDRPPKVILPMAIKLAKREFG